MGRKPSSYFTCKRHKPFPTEEAAYAHLRERIKAGEVDPGMTTFRCARCRQWHIGGTGFRSLERLIRQALAHAGRGATSGKEVADER